MFSLLLLAAAAAAAASPSPAASPAAAASPSTAATPAAPEYAFALSNADGSKLLALAPVADPARLTKASCSGKVLDIAFASQQKKGDSDNGHQTAENFDQAEGPLFNVKGGGADPDTSCLLATEAFFKARAPASLTAATGTCSPADSSAAASLGKRAVKQCDQVGTFAGGRLLVAQYASKGKSMLAGLVLLGDNKLAAIRAFPATHEKDSQDCWRADDACNFDSKAYHVPFVLAGPKGTALFGLWDGPEGQNVELLELKGATLSVSDKTSRYWAAE